MNKSKFRVGNLIRYSPQSINTLLKLYKAESNRIVNAKTRVYEIVDINKRTGYDLITVKIKLTNKEDKKNIGYSRVMTDRELINDFVLTKHKVNIFVPEIKSYYHPLTRMFSNLPMNPPTDIKDNILYQNK